MKRILLILISAICIASGVHAQDIVNLRQEAQSMGLRYQVASVDEDVLVRKEYFREDWPERKWFRDDLRNCLREESGNVYTFDKKGLMTKHVYTLRGAHIRETVCTYQPNGHLATLTGEGCKVTGKTGTSYNIYAESNTYASLMLDNRKGDYAFDLKCNTEWSDDDRLLASRYSYVDSLPAKTFEYQYNHLGQITEVAMTTYMTDGTEPQRTVTRYAYDQHDCLKKMTVRGEGIDDTYTFENNSQGDPVRLTYTTPFSTTNYEYEYQYDESGNWVMRLQWKDGVFENATLRTITYHKDGDAQSQKLAQAEAAKQQADREAKEKARAEKAAEKEKAKAQKADKPQKEPKQKAEKSPKEPKQKAEKSSKEPKQKAEKPQKKTKRKGKKNLDPNLPEELQ